MRERPPADHYSYTVYADPATARTFDDRRFGGPIGEVVAGAQASVLLEFLGPVAQKRVLDVGTGTGRAALLLAKAGAIVTAVDASDTMLAVASERAAEQGLPISFQRGDAHALAFSNRSFDAAVSLRVLMHTPEWRACIAELCRVSDRFVVVDYPAASSTALIQSVARWFAHRLGARTEPYRVFTNGEVARAFRDAGFAVRDIQKQFALPIAFHKAIGSVPFTRQSEALCRRVGLVGLFGSPVTLVAERA